MPIRVRGRVVEMSLSRACRKTARCLFRVFSWVPVIFVIVVLIWGYYVYVYVMNISGTFPKGGSNKQISVLISVILLIIAHVILGLQVTSFVRTIFAKHRRMPDQFCLSEDQLETLESSTDEAAVLSDLAADLPVHTRTRSGSVRYCDTCVAIKPDRCHHCSLCDRCVLKMDHHCPWVNNCVGYANYKFFVLFLFYTVLMSVWFCSSGAYDFARAWNGTIVTQAAEKFNVIFCYFVSALFGFSTAMLLIFHIYLVLINKTTLENSIHPVVLGGPNRKLYYLGVKRNIQQVFGARWLLALIPVHTSEGNGFEFPLNRSHDIEMSVRRNGSHSQSELSQTRGQSAPDDVGVEARPDVEEEEEEESEVEVYAGDPETQPLTQTAHT